jgi:hypothetical protein
MFGSSEVIAPIPDYVDLHEKHAVMCWTVDVFDDRVARGTGQYGTMSYTLSPVRWEDVQVRAFDPNPAPDVGVEAVIVSMLLGR